jgi:hypothetical protein
MPDPTISPELFDKATLLALFPGILPADAPASMTTALTTMLSECIDAANKAGEAGATPLLAKVVLETMSLICTNSAMWIVTDYNAALAAAGQPPTAPIVATPPEALPMVNGVSTGTLGPGDSVTLTVGALAAPDVDTPVLLAIALDPSRDQVGYPTCSLEVKYLAPSIFTYTAGTIWPGITLYAKSGDLMRLSIGDDGTVRASISQDDGVTWAAFFDWAALDGAPLYAHLTTTINGTSALVTKGSK